MPWKLTTSILSAGIAWFAVGVDIGVTSFEDEFKTTELELAVFLLFLLTQNPIIKTKDKNKTNFLFIFKYYPQLPHLQEKLRRLAFFDFDLPGGLYSPTSSLHFGQKATHLWQGP